MEKSKPVYEETCMVMLPQQSSTHKEAEETSNVKQYAAAIIATLGAFAAGSVMAWTSPSLPNLQAPDSHIPVTTQEGSWIGCLMAIGALAGALPAGVFADAIGRKIAMQSISVPFVLSWILIVFAESVGVLYAARIIAGIGVGAICVVAPIYVGETASSSIRGSLGGFFQLQITIGILFAYAVGAVVSFKMLAILSGIIPVVFFIGLFFVPETPHYLLTKNRKHDAEKSMLWLRGDRAKANQEELSTIQAAILKDMENNLSFGASMKSLFTDYVCRRAIIVGLGLMFFQQLSGINAVIFYTVAIFDAAGSTLSPSLAAIIVGVVQVGVTYAATILVDKAGRRILLMLSSSVMALCLAVLGVHFYLLETGVDVSNLGLIPLASVVLFIVMFSLGFGPIPWTMLGELFPGHIKGAASALACVENYILCFAVTKTFQNLLDTLGSSFTFWIFAGICAIGTVFVFFRVPETKGKSLEEIQQEMAK
ncbi:hypothetical protein B566_EDAN001517 [Ephemera danica]|nr:hypothetical protein B566_EDAN001517 [Ephemera danica]